MARPVADVLEDAELLDGNGVGATDAVARLEFPSSGALEKWLERHGRYDIWLRMKARDPEGAHSKEARMAAPVQTVDPIAALIARGKKSERARIRSKAERIESMVSELDAALSAEVESNREKAKARAEVARLEKQLAEAKARLRGAPLADSGPSAAEVRAWAAENGVACTERGRVPSAVVDAYLAAQDKAVA